MRYSEAIRLIEEEYVVASSKFPPMRSAHEGYAIIKEELDELWEDIRSERSTKVLSGEARQVGAMALRFLVDCC